MHFFSLFEIFVELICTCLNPRNFCKFKIFQRNPFWPAKLHKHFYEWIQFVRIVETQNRTWWFLLSNYLVTYHDPLGLVWDWRLIIIKQEQPSKNIAGKLIIQIFNCKETPNGPSHRTTLWMLNIREMRCETLPWQQSLSFVILFPLSYWSSSKSF